MSNGTSCKRLIVDSRTGKFLAPEGKWTDDEAHAIDFPDIHGVIAECIKHRIWDAEVVLRFRGPARYDARFPLREKKGVPAQRPGPTRDISNLHRAVYENRVQPALGAPQGAGDLRGQATQQMQH